jgi:hypothetical protein
MSGAAEVIGAITGFLIPVGGGIAFIWNKVERRFRHLETKVDACEKRERESRERRGVQLTVIELLWQELVRHVPESPVFTRAKKLLDDLKAMGQENREEGN